MPPRLERKIRQNRIVWLVVIKSACCDNGLWREYGCCMSSSITNCRITQASYTGHKMYIAFVVSNNSEDQWEQASSA